MKFQSGSPATGANTTPNFPPGSRSHLRAKTESSAASFAGLRFFRPIGAGSLAWADRGMSLARGGDLSGALRSLQRSIESDPDCYEAWLSLHEVFTALHDRRRARLSLRVARRLRWRARPPISKTALG